MNTVIHTSQEIERIVIDSYDETNVVVPLGVRYVVSGPNAHWYSWGLYGEVRLSDLSVVYNRSEQALISATVHEFYNENSVDNLLNLVESPKFLPSLRDFDSRLARLEKFQYWPRGWDAKMRRLKLLGRAGKNLLDVGSAGLLGYSFGIAPLVGDMLTMAESIPSIRKGFVSARREADKVIRVRQALVGKPTFNCSGPGFRSDPDTIDNNWWTVRPEWSTPPKKICVVTGRRDRPRYYNDTLQKVDRLLRKYLSAGPASAVWEALPFSFVLDWFVDTSKVIDSLNESLTGLDSTIKHVSLSRKIEVDAKVYKLKQATWVSDSDGKLTVHNRLRDYHRESIQLNTIVRPSGRFGKKQAALAGALLHEIVSKLSRMG